MYKREQNKDNKYNKENRKKKYNLVKSLAKYPYVNNIFTGKECIYLSEEFVM